LLCFIDSSIDTVNLELLKTEVNKYIAAKVINDIDCQSFSRPCDEKFKDEDILQAYEDFLKLIKELQVLVLTTVITEKIYDEKCNLIKDHITTIKDCVENIVQSYKPHECDYVYTLSDINNFKQKPGPDHGLDLFDDSDDDTFSDDLCSSDEEYSDDSDDGFIPFDQL
jgi:hypothetical protein